MLLNSIIKKHSGNGLGIRINASDTKDYLLDLSLLAGKSIDNIFLPKTKNAAQVLELRNILNKNRTKFKNIIPVIETKSGMLQLENIVDRCDFIKYIGFGHCDYNSNVGVFPFFHQDNKEYWDWINYINIKIKNKNIRFINSPLLQLENKSLFVEMLQRLAGLWGDEFGQISLSQKQSLLCSQFSKGSFIPKKLFSSINKTAVFSFAENVINTFERNNTKKGFSIDADSKTIISPQEYFSAVSLLNKSNLPEINFTFMGGCFPVQGGVCFEDRFHQLLKRKIETQFEVRFNVNIIRYERLYKYIDYAGKIKWSINFALVKMMAPEEFDLLKSDRLNKTFRNKNKSFQNKLFLSINLLLGALAGNFSFSVERYLSVTNEIIDYCKKNNIMLVVLGPPLKRSSKIESIISRIFARKIRILDNQLKGNYIDGSVVKINNVELFDNTGIYANEHYHAYAANSIFDKLNDSLSSFQDNDCAAGKSSLRDG